MTSLAPKSTGPRRPAPPPGMMYGPNDMLIPIPKKPKGPVKPSNPGKPTRTGNDIRTGGVKDPIRPTRVVDDSGMMPKGVVSTPRPAPTVDKTGMPLAFRDYMAKNGMAKGGMAKKGMAKGGMAKKGMNKGGMANCGASMKPAQKGKK